MQQVNEAYTLLSNPDKYRTRQQARPNPGTYGSYGSYGYGQANRQSQAGWRYYTYTTDSQDDAWRVWQDLRDEAYASQQRRSSAPVTSPLRGVVRVVSWIMIMRVILSFLRMLMFGFLP